MSKRGQISTEYLMLISFVTFAIITALGISFLYAGGVQDSVGFNQIESFADRVIGLSESVSFAGPPATTQMEGFLPESVEAIAVTENAIVFNISTRNGQSVIAFESSVVLNGSIPAGGGTKVLQLTAYDDYVNISTAS